MKESYREIFRLSLTEAIQDKIYDVMITHHYELFDEVNKIVEVTVGRHINNEITKRVKDE